MKIKTVYTCEICGSAYETENGALECEKLGKPEFYNKFVNKWIIVPTIIRKDKYINEEMTISDTEISYILVKVKWNKIVSLSEKLQMFKLLKNEHKLELICTTIIPFTYREFVNEFFKYAIIVDEEFYEELNKKQIDFLNAKPLSVEESLVDDNNLINKIICKMNISLPEVDKDLIYKYSGKYEIINDANR
jgi:hypothetical protein